MVHQRSWPLLSILFVAIFCFGSCTKNESVSIRTYRMGFANSAPRYDDFNLVLQSLNLWTTHADAAILSDEVPWDSLFGGVSPPKFILHNYVGLVNFYRGKKLKLWVYIDPANGLDRSTNSTKLTALGKSIADADAQQMFRKYAVAMDSMLNPDHLGLALETNLIRDLSPAPIYNGIKAAVNAAASEIKAKDPIVKLSVSVQVDDAWGKIFNDSYKGVGQDFIDFPFVEELGLSSYPYFVFDKPSDIPVDYYSKLVEGKNIPVFVSEGGWSSSPLTVSGKITKGTNELQKEYISYQHQLLARANAIGYFQLAFTDIDVAKLPPTVPSNSVYFVFLGMVDINLNRKPAFDAWDGMFKKSLKPGS